MTKSILANVDRSRIRYEPYPHVVVPDALDPAWYAELEATFPRFEKIVAGRPVENNKVYLLNAVDVLDDPEIPRIWRDFFAYHCSDAFFREMLDFWSEGIRREYPDIERRFGKPLDRVTTGLRRRGVAKTPENLERDAMLDVQFGVNSPVDQHSRVRGPHVDKPQKLYAALLYFRRPEDDVPGGDLDLFRFRSDEYYFDGRFDLKDEYVERFDTVRYAPNTLVAWLNTPRSLHGVTPRPPNDTTRRYVNFLCECYGLPDGGFFPIRRSRTGLAVSALRRALGFRDA